MAKYFSTVGTVEFNEAVAQGEINLELLFDIVLETSLSTLRYSLDGSKFIIKTNSEQGKDYLKTRAHQLGIPYKEYTYEAMLEEIQKPEWQIEE